MKTKLILGGIPYALDIKKLEDAFPVPSLTEGRILVHDELVEVLGIEARTHRYYGVINSWRNKLKTVYAIHVHWEQTIGVRVLNPAELHMRTEGRIRQKGGQFSRSVNELKWIPRDRLDSIGQQRLDNTIIAAAKMKAAIAGGVKELAIDLAPIKSLPKPKLIERTG